MITFKEVIQKLKTGKQLLLKFNLCGGLFSQHELTFHRGLIHDHSFVDDSDTRYTVKQYHKSFYGKAFTQKAVQLLEENEI